MVNTTAPRHPPVVDLADFAARKDEITADLMKAATTIGARPGGPGPWGLGIPGTGELARTLPVRGETLGARAVWRGETSSAALACG